jgi:hypothetical protein
MSNEFNLTEADEAQASKVSALLAMFRDLILGVAATITETFASDANRTPDPATVQLAYRILVTSGVSLTATRDLIMPAKKHVWSVTNNTTGGRAIRVIAASGTGVTIPNGQTATVVYDGTNFVAVGFQSPAPAGYGMLNFAADSLTVGVGTSYFAFPDFITTVAPTTERWHALPKGGKLSNLRVICAIAPVGGAAGVTFTVRKKSSAGGGGAGTDTALLCTVPIGGFVASDTTNVVDVADGDEISVKIVEGVGYTGSMARIKISMQITY